MPAYGFVVLTPDTGPPVLHAAQLRFVQPDGGVETAKL